jgi:hypothetical protein
VWVLDPRVLGLDLRALALDLLSYGELELELGMHLGSLPSGGAAAVATLVIWGGRRAQPAIGGVQQHTCFSCGTHQ